MATFSPKKSPIIVDCPMCIRKLENPKALSCLHFYCEQCISTLKPATEGAVTGYQCPQCGKFTAQDGLQPMGFVQDVHGTAELSEDEHKLCGKCSHDIAAYRCLDCKENYCTACREQHDEWSMFRSHVIEDVKEGSLPVIDKHVYCSRHRGKLIELHCRDCDKLVCVICNGTTHKNHTAETIQEALESALPRLEKDTEKLNDVIASTQTALEKAKGEQEKIKKQYGDIESAINQKYEDVVEKIQHDRRKIKQELKAFENKDIEEIHAHIKHLDLKLKGQVSLSKLARATLSKVQGTSLLHALESGLQDSLTLQVEQYPETEAYTKEINAELLLGELFEGTTFGGISPPTGIVTGATKCVAHSAQSSTNTPHSNFIPRLLTGVDKVKIKHVHENDLSFPSVKFAKINEQLWFVERDKPTIKICSQTGSVVREVQVTGAGACCSVVQTDSDVIVAATQGLFTTTLRGYSIHQITDGVFSDVTASRDKVYALDESNGKIQVFRKEGHSHTKYTNDGDIFLEHFSKDMWNTLQVTSDYIFISQYGGHKIMQYTLVGEYVATRYSPGNKTGQMNHPRLCGADSSGTILIADCVNHRLQTLTADGAWGSLAVEGLGTYPWFCALSNRKLLVLHFSWSDNCHKLQEFSIL